MRKMPQRLALFFILITIARVAFFMVQGLHVGPLGYAFAIGLAAGVYVSAFYVRFPQTQKAAIVSLVFFLTVDLWFNEFEVIRTMAEAENFSSAALFLSWDAEILRKMVQFSALVFGAFPTFAAALLGWMQSGAEKANLGKRRAWFGQFGLQFGAKILSYFPEISEDGQNRPALTGSSDVIEGNTGLKVSKGRLVSEDWDWISAHAVRQIAVKYGTSVRNARNWKAEAARKE